jgi:translocation and assembly module TamB
MKNGRLHVKKFELSGGNDIFLKMIENHEAESKVDVQVSGKLDLGLLSLLTPFFEDLRGILTFAFNAHGGTDGVSLLGSAYIDKGFLKFFDFPHAFEDLQADLLFNQKKIIFNSIKTEFGGGRAVAQGGMELNGYKNFPVNVTATFDKVTLNVPDKVSTTGAGTLSFTGSWFPFLLKGEYNVREGLITKEFGGDSDEADGIRRSIFLPELLLKESFAPVLLDVKVNFEKGIAIKNEMLEGKVLGQLTVRGNPAKPSLSGTVTTDSDTKLNFKDTVFEVTSANVQFDDPNEINPRLFVTARSRVKDHDVSLQVQGTGKKPDFVLSSVPPLAEKEIISLLALGATDTDLDKNVSSQAQASQTGLQIGSGVLKNNPLSKIVKDATGFDVQLAPSFDDTNSAVQKIIVTRQFTPNLGVAGSRSIGKKSETEARVKYRLNDRLSVIGSWKGADYQDVSEPTVQSENSQNNNFGVDLEYKVEFK